MCHQVNRLCTDNGVDTRVKLIDSLVQCHGTTRDFPSLSHTVLDLHDIPGYDIPPCHVAGRDQEVVTFPAGRYGSVSRYHQSLITSSPNNIYHLRADGTLLGRVINIHEMRYIRREVVHVLRHLLVGQVIDASQPFGIYYGAAAKLQCFESLVRVHHIRSPQHYPMIFHDHGLVTGILKLVSDFLSEVVTSWRSIRRETDISTNIVCLWNNFGVRHDPGNAKGDQGRG